MTGHRPTREPRRSPFVALARTAAPTAARMPVIPAAAALLLIPALPPGAPGTLVGQEEPADTAGAAQEAPGPVPVEELFVTAHRVPVSEDALAASATVITREEVEASGAGHVLDLLRTVPGVDVVQNGSWGGPASLFLRGGESNYVQVLIDGVPVNEPGGDFDFSALTTDNVERIEILRGPASVLYGSDAVAGVVQIFTRRGGGAPRASVRGRGGTFGSLDWGASHTGGGEAARYSFDLSRFETDGILDFNNRYRNTVASGRVRVDPDERTEAALSLRFTDHRAHTPTDGAGEPVDENQFRYGERLTAGLEVGRSLTDGLDATVQLSRHEHTGGFDDAPDGPADTLGTFAFQSQSSVSRTTADARLDWRPGGATVITAGAEVEDAGERSFSETRSEFGPGTDRTDVERANRGYYLQALAEPLGGVALNAGVRLDDNDAFGTFTPWRLGGAWRVGGGFRLRASVGTAFKEPTFLENFAEGFTTGNPDLDPERSRSFEVGAEQSLLNGRLSLTGAWFHQRFEDLIQFTPTPPAPGEPNFFNVPGADARGIELGAEVSLPGGLTGRAGYTYLQTEITESGFDSGPDATFVEGKRLLRRPPHSASVALRYALPEGGSLRLAASHVGARTDRDFSVTPAERVELPAHTRVDLAARYRLVGGGGKAPAVTPTLRVDNLLDAAYEEVLNFPARGRTILAGARVDFPF